jgi:two-component system OmpR family response regulator
MSLETSAAHTGPVLVVDDDAVVRRVICRALEDEGLQVMAAANGRLAIEQANRNPPALVVLDMSLPLLGGDAVAAALRARVGHALPILVITADGHPAEKARALGAFAYLPKPFEMDELLARVHEGLAIG